MREIHWEFPEHFVLAVLRPCPPCMSSMFEVLRHNDRSMMGYTQTHTFVAISLFAHATILDRVSLLSHEANYSLGIASQRSSRSRFAHATVSTLVRRWPGLCKCYSGPWYVIRHSITVIVIVELPLIVIAGFAGLASREAT